MKRIVLPILLFAVLIWLVPLAGFLLAWACSKAFCLRTTQGKTPF